MPPRADKAKSSMPPRADKAKSSVPPARRKSKAPPRRQTMEVQMAWLDPPAIPAIANEAPPPSSRRKPPRVPGAPRTLPPMPLIPTAADLEAASPRHHTMEVEMNWLELIDENANQRKEAGLEEKALEAGDAEAIAREQEPALARQSESIRPSSKRSSRPASLRPSRPPSRRPSRPPSSRPLPIEEAMTPRKKSRKPIPRED